MPDTRARLAVEVHYHIYAYDTVGKMDRVQGPLPGKEWLARVVCAAAAVFSLLVIPLPVCADTAAGRQAYEKGDYRRAMVEWQAAADHNDPEAEFGLGNLYEFGADDLKQDYTRAVYWYRKAADQGNAAAQYRLALLYSAGGDNFEIDLAEAYKWATLGAQNRGVWGTLAGDFKNHLERALTNEERSEAARRAKKWQEERVAAAATGGAAQSSSPSPESTTPSWHPPKPAFKPPGWPDVPIGPKGVEGLPPPPFAIDGKQPSVAAVAPPRVNPPPPRANIDDELRAVECATLQSKVSPQGEMTITGTVPSGDAKTKLVQIVDRLNPETKNSVDVAIVPPPICTTLVAFDKLRRTDLFQQSGINLGLVRGTTNLKEGDPIAIAVRGPSYGTVLRIDYFALDGRVLHMWPNQEEPIIKLAPGSERIFDRMGSSPWNVGGPPFGTELIVVIATPQSLSLGQGRPAVEDAERYLDDLKVAFQRLQGVGSAPGTMASLLITTSAR